jgi:hypothetical protein
MENRVYLGIDVGSKGFITLNTGSEFKFYSIADNDIYQLSDIFRDIKNEYPNVVCVMELIHAIFGSSAKATFAFGEINGILKGLLMANKIPYHLVPPKTWQKEMWDNKDLVVSYKTMTVKGKDVSKKDINTKQTSINAAKRIFPNIDLRKTERCKNPDDNKVDSLLIAEYGRRKNL